MKKQRYFRIALGATMIAVLGFSVLAQKNLDLSIAGIKIGDRDSAKAFLEGYSSRQSDDGRPVFLFYNKTGTEVLKLISVSQEDRYFITEIEIFTVGQSYQNRLYIAEKFDSFETESGVFLGLRQSATSLLFGIPNKIGPKDLMKKKGEPKARVKDDKREVLSYDSNSLELANETNKFNYSASYEFYKNTLKKITLKISADK
ncbi:hypothetical protein BH10ACI1_BH10ACI1_17760 [soil metagenome]